MASSPSQGSPSGGGTGEDPHELCVPPHKILICNPLSLLNMTKFFFRYVFNLCMAKANLSSTTSLIKDETLLSLVDKLDCVIAVFLVYDIIYQS